MSNYAKYIVFQDANRPETPGEEYHCIVFPPIVNHDDACEAYQHRCAYQVMPVGAGFVSIGAKNDEDHVPTLSVGCHGESLRLKIKSRFELDDKVLLKRLFQPYG